MARWPPLALLALVVSSADKDTCSEIHIGSTFGSADKHDVGRIPQRANVLSAADCCVACCLVDAGWSWRNGTVGCRCYAGGGLLSSDAESMAGICRNCPWTAAIISMVVSWVTAAFGLGVIIAVQSRRHLAWQLLDDEHENVVTTQAEIFHKGHEQDEDGVQGQHTASYRYKGEDAHGNTFHATVENRILPKEVWAQLVEGQTATVRYLEDHPAHVMLEAYSMEEKENDYSNECLIIIGLCIGFPGLYWLITVPMPCFSSSTLDMVLVIVAYVVWVLLLILSAYPVSRITICWMAPAKLHDDPGLE